MKLTSYIEWLNESNDDKVIILMPGSYKPMHVSHVDLINRYANHPNVKEVRVLIGSGIRNGVTPKESYEIAEELLKNNKKVSIEFSKYPSPILTAYKYITDEANLGIYALGGVNKGTDYERVLKFVKDFSISGKYYEQKSTDVEVIEFSIDANPLLYKGRTDEHEGEPISASILRKDVLNNDFDNFKTNYIGYSENLIKRIWDICKDVIKESLNENEQNLIPSNVIDAFYDRIKKQIDLHKDKNHPHVKKELERIKLINGNKIPKRIKNLLNEKLIEEPELMLYSDADMFQRIKQWMKSKHYLYMNKNDALVFCAEHGNIEFVKFLLKKGADIHTYNNAAIWYANYFHYNDILNVFKKHIEKEKHSNLVKESFSTKLYEGGNIFDKATSIYKEHINSTIEQFKRKLNFIFPNVNFKFELLGSAGKKDISGDIDLALSEDTIFDNNENVKYEDWNISYEDFSNLYELTRKRSRTSTEKQSKLHSMIKLISQKLIDNGINSDSKKSGNSTIFCEFPQYDNEGNQLDKAVQIDVNIGDLKWLRFSYHSEVYRDNVKGLHRTQLLVALFANKQRMFKHGTGIINAETREYEARNPEEAINLLNDLYNFKIDFNTINDFFKLYVFLIKNINEEELHKIYDIYLKILDSTRTDIPIMLQKYWVENKERLGLQGKFLPEDSNLYKYTR